MPRINRLTARQAQVAPTPNPEAMGAAEGRALASIGTAIGNTGATVARVGQQIWQIKDGYQQQLAVSKSTEAEDRLRRFAEDLERDPEFDSREKKFKEQASVLREELGRDLAPGPRRAQFENALTRAYNSHGVTVRTGALRDQMSSAEIMANNTTRRLATVAATATNELDQVVARLEGEGVLTSLGEQFGIDPIRTQEAVRQFNIEVDDAIYANLMRTDPVAAFRGLEVPEQGLAKGRTEVERQTMLTRAINEVESRLQSSAQTQSAQDRLAELQRKKLADAAQRTLIELAQTPGGVTAEVVNGYGGILKPEQSKSWLEFAANGGRITRTKLNPIVFKDLKARAKAGDDVTDAVFEAELRGDLDVGARNALLNSSSDTRFGIADDLLTSALKVGEFDQSPAVRSRNARAETLYELWKVENPNATLEEALEQAQMQADRALIFDDSSITAFQLPPQFSVYDASGKTLNIQETKKALTSELVSGNLSESEYDREIDLLEKFDAAQKSQAARERLKAQQQEPNK